MSRPDEYLAIPDEYGRWLGGLRWSADGEAVEHVAEDPAIGLTFAMEGEIALFLAGLHSVRSPIPFAYVLHLLHLLGSGPRRPAPAGAAHRLLSRFSAAFQESGRPLRNAGALCGMLCRNVPRATDPPDLSELDDHLRQGLGTGPKAGPRPEVPSLEPEEFQDRVQQALFALDDDTLLHWFRHGRGPIGDAGEAVAREAIVVRPPTLLEILDALGRRPRLKDAAPLVSQLDGALFLPSRRLEASSLPIGGYVDVTTRGQPEQILASQFALDDLEFLRRFAGRELLYYHREDPLSSADRELVLVLDQGVRTWGDVRLVLAASALALARRAARMGLSLWIAATGAEEGPEPASGMSEDMLGRLIEGSDLSPHPGEALGRVLEAPAGAALRDVVLLTHPRNLAEPDVSSASREVAPGTRLFAVAVDESGGVELSEVRRGVPVPLSRCRVTIPDVPAVTPASDGNAKDGWRGDVEPIGFPFSLGATHPIEDGAYDFDHSGDWILAATGKFGLLHAWKVDGSRTEMLPRAMIGGKILAPVEAVVGVAGGFVVAGRRSTGLVMAHYDLTARVCTSYDIGPPPAPRSSPQRHDLRWSYDRQRHSIVVVNAKAPAALACAIDLGAEQVLACFGDPSRKTSKRAMLAAVKAGDLPSTRMLILAEGFPLPPEVNAIRLDRDSGLLGARAEGVWAQFTPLSDGVPALKGARLLHARCGGGNIAILAEDARKQRSLRVYAMPDGRSLGDHAVKVRVDTFAMSPDGRRLAYGFDRYILAVRHVGGGAVAWLLTSRSRVHDGLALSLGEGCFEVRAGKHAHLVAWNRGPLRVVPSHDGVEHGCGPLIPATRVGPSRPDSNRFFASCAVGSITGLVDHLGHVAILDADLATVAVFFAFRGRIAAWLPDGTRLGPPELIGGPPSPGAEDRIAEALRGAERRGRSGR